MKLSLSWLKRHLDTSADLQKICDTLTAIGLEVESVKNHGKALKDFIVAEVLTAEKHPNADKLKVTIVNTGKEKLQVVCGAPNCRAGMKTIFAREGLVIPNGGMILKKTKIRDVESNGMLCGLDELNLPGPDPSLRHIADLSVDAKVGLSATDYFGLDDVTIEINVTPNRGDALGVHGIARDLAAAGLGKLKTEKATKVKIKGKSPIQVEIKSDGCSLFTGRLIKGVKNGESPQWLKKLLESVGQKSISALVDVTNFFTIDQGRPLHVFDADRIKGKMIIRDTKAGDQFKGLDGKTYTAIEGMIGVYDDSGFIDLAGIMGGESTAVDENTTNVFLEAAAFDQIRIAKAGRALSIHTDARHRFERFVDPHTVMPAQEAATAMIIDLCGGEASDIVVAGAVPKKVKTIAFDPGKIFDLSGVEVSDKIAKDILSKLGFDIKAASKKWTVTVPTWRPDVEGPADLVEEVVRVYGFDKIPTTPLDKPTGISPAILTASQKRVREVKRSLAARGLYEAVTWSFLSKKTADLFGGQVDGLRLTNPISADLDVMRPSILPNLLQAAQRNADRGQMNAKLFEVGPIFTKAIPGGQETLATGVRFGNAGDRHWQEKVKAADVFDVKADVFAVLSSLGFSSDSFAIESPAAAIFHPGRSGKVMMGQKMIAEFGDVHPRILKALDVKSSAAAFHIYLDAIPLRQKKGAAKLLLKLSPFQAVERDFAFVVNNQVSANDLIKVVKTIDKDLIESVSIFDVYQGKGVEDGKKSIALSVRLQPTTATLTDGDIEAVSKKIVDGVMRETGASLRR